MRTDITIGNGSSLKPKTYVRADIGSAGASSSSESKATELTSEVLVSVRKCKIESSGLTQLALQGVDKNEPPNFHKPAIAPFMRPFFML